MRYVFSKCYRALCFALVGAASGQAIAAGTVDVTVGDCTAGTHLVASEARLSDVFERLAKELSFKLHYRAASDPVINIDVTRPSAELITSLTAAENVMVGKVADPACPGLSKITQVWVLAAGGGDASRQSVGVQRHERSSEAALEMYYKAHGGSPNE